MCIFKQLKKAKVKEFKTEMQIVRNYCSLLPNIVNNANGILSIGLITLRARLICLREPSIVSRGHLICPRDTPITLRVCLIYSGEALIMPGARSICLRTPLITLRVCLIYLREPLIMPG
jgi:hypothetical protein